MTTRASQNGTVAAEMEFEAAHYSNTTVVSIVQWEGKKKAREKLLHETARSLIVFTSRRTLDSPLSRGV
jgi:hypothetical protein